MDKVFRLAIVGAGRQAMSHLPAALGCTRVKVVALVDPVVQRAHRLARRFALSPRLVESIDEVLGEIDGAVIATPNDTHCELALKCLQAGVSTLIEKPLATSVKEGEAIVRAAEEHQATVAVGYYTRFFESVPLMRDLLKANYFGRIRRFACRVGHRGGWAPYSAYNLSRRASGGGVLVVNGTHFLDRILYWFGYPDDLDYQDDSLGGPEANALAEFRYSRGPMAFEGSVRLSKTVPLRPGGFVVETDEGWVILRESEEAPIRFRPRAYPSLETIIQRSRKGLSATREPSLQLQLEDFIDACLQKREPMVSACQGLESLRLIEALYSRRSSMKMDWYDRKIFKGEQ
jgi:predicted dehydrogenase